MITVYCECRSALNPRKKPAKIQGYQRDVQGNWAEQYPRPDGYRSLECRGCRIDCRPSMDSLTQILDTLDSHDVSRISLRAFNARVCAPTKAVTA